eukprot:jgi/Hompol1/3694/HPOL_006778-RA
MSMCVPSSFFELSLGIIDGGDKHRYRRKHLQPIFAPQSLRKVVAFSWDFGSVKNRFDGTDSEYHEMFKKMMSIMQSRIGLPSWLWPYAGISPSSPSVLVLNEYLKSILQPVIDDRRAKIASGAATKDIKDMDMLDRMLQSQSETEQHGWTDAELISEVTGMYFADNYAVIKSFVDHTCNLTHNML